MPAVPPALLPPDENERIRALKSYAVLDTEPEEEFDRIARMASRIFEVPVAFVTFLEHERQFMKARVGLDVCEGPRDISFCSHTILGDDTLVVPDTAEDPRFAGNPYVTEAPHVRFYAGTPLVTPCGHRIGTVCLLDTEPRQDLEARDRETLRDLAAVVMERLERRRAERERDAQAWKFRNIAETSPDGIICADSRGIVTSWNSAAEAMFGHGAADAIGQPLDFIFPAVRRPRMRAALESMADRASPQSPGQTVELKASRRDGTVFPIELSLSRWEEDAGTMFGVIVRDISERKSAEQRLKHTAEHDSLTGLLNRGGLLRRMAQACARQTHASILLVDLDGFKPINDTLGHSAGDHVLRVVAGRLEALASRRGAVARLGGDEFVVFCPGAADPLAAASLGEALIAAVEEPVEHEGQYIYLGASVGIAVRDAHECGAEALLGNADLALYQAKADGRRVVRLFTREMRHTAAVRGQLDVELRRAWEQGELELYYQPQVRLSDRKITGAEALIRWNRPGHGIVSPAAFLPALESGLLAAPVGEWIIRSACAQAARWRAEGFRDFRMGVNLFAAQFRTRDFAGMVERALSDSGLPPEGLELEITENIILQSEQNIAEPLGHLRSLGVGVAFDDFGTGFASLSMLKDYPVSRLKIDRSFVRSVERSGQDQAVIQAVVRLASGFDLDVIAEGVETAEQASLMQRHGCGEAQGYLFGRPMTAESFVERFGPGSSSVGRVA